MSMAKEATGTNIELDIVILLNGLVGKVPSKYLCYTHSPGILSTFVRDTCFCSGQQLMERYVTDQSIENKRPNFQSFMGYLYQKAQCHLHFDSGNVIEEEASHKRQRWEGLRYNAVYQLS